MAEKRDESSVLFSLRTLRALAPDDDVASATDETAGAARPARTPDRRRGAESLDLLADVRASVAAEAALESDRRTAAESARRAEAERRLQETSALQRAEIEARLAAEAARQRAAAEERALRSRGEPATPPGPAPTPVVTHDPRESLGGSHPADAFAVEAASLALTAPNPPARGRTAFFAIVVGLPVACVTAVALALVARDRGAVPPEAPPSLESPGVASGAAAAASARQAGSSAPVALTGAAGKTPLAAGEGAPAVGPVSKTPAPVATPAAGAADRRTGQRNDRRDARPDDRRSNTPRRPPAPASKEGLIIDYGKD